MGNKKFKVCECCNTSLPANREYFKRIKNSNTGKESLSTICRECEKKLEYKKHWDGDKLICLCCGKNKDVTEFSSHSAYAIRGHRDSRCNECKNIQNKNFRKKYSDELKLLKTIQTRILNAKSKALRKGIPCTITKEFVKNLWDKQEGLCAISKIPMTYEMDSGRIFTNISIDQINPGVGYTEDNIQLVCSAVNLLKSNWDIDTVIYICQSIIDNYNHV